MSKNSYIRELESDVLGIYSGSDEDGRHSLFVKLKNRPHISFHSSLLITKISIRSDRQWAFQVSLIDDRYLGVFRVLVSDLVDVVSQEKNQLIAERKLMQRYSEWEHLFEQATNERLSREQIKGLIGELYFMNFCLFPSRGVVNSVRSWIGPEASDKDFQFKEDWFEVKTKSVNSNSVTISNKNQLKSRQIGFLTIISCELSSELSVNAYNLYDLCQVILKKITDIQIRQKYMEKLARLGFIPSKEYQEFAYEIKVIDYYMVNSSFPCVDYPDDGSILNVKYELNLPMLKDYKKEEATWNNIEKKL